MEFAGNKYAYISKNKIENLHLISQNNSKKSNSSNNMNNLNNLNKTIDKFISTKKELKRERSIERINDKELDVIKSSKSKLFNVSTQN